MTEVKGTTQLNPENEPVYMTEYTIRPPIQWDEIIDILLPPDVFKDDVITAYVQGADLTLKESPFRDALFLVNASSPTIESEVTVKVIWK